MSENKKENKKRLFSKALFKQSCKANGTMWLIITVAVCFMLACVMLISGTSSVSSVKEGIQDTIVEKTIESSVKKSAVDLYQTTDDAEYIFDKAFAEKITELNTKANYNKISKVTTAATDQATQLVTDNVTEKVKAEVESIMTDKVTDEVTDEVTAAVTAELTKQVTEKVTEMVTQETTSRITTEITNEVTSLVTSEVTKRITNEVSNAVLSYIFNDNGLNKVQALISSGMCQTDAVSSVISEDLVSIQTQAASIPTPVASYLNNYTEFAPYTPESVQSTIQSITATETANINTAEHQAAVAAQVQSEESTMNSFKQQATAEINTSEHQLYVSNAVLTENKDAYTTAASAEVLTDANKLKVKNEVLKNQQAYVDAAKKKIVTDSNTTKVTNTVLAENKNQYTEQAKEELSSTITSITNKATDKVTDIITETYVKPAYEYAVDQVMAAYPEDVDESKYGAAMVAINPDNQADDQYTDNNEAIPDEYVTALTEYLKDDIMAWKNGKATNTLADYIDSDERAEFRHERAYDAVSMLIGSNITSEDSKQEILDKLADYSVDEEKYDSFGFDYEKCKTLAYEATSSYQDQVDYEVGRISNSIKENETLYKNKVQEIKDDAYSATSGSFLDGLPENVTDGLKELGTMDLYGLIVGSIFFKMAGLLLPIIYIIMVSNNLIASQVDTGSMAYVLSTSTRRKEVTFTQGLYLIGSTFLMFVFTTITSCVCFKLVDVNTDLTYEKLLLINLGAFVTMLAISGINFFTSCIFDRSKRAMAIGGGVSIFFLVATMLGLFGSPVIPSVVRITALNNFNYVSIISLFDVVSILDGTDVWMYKMIILLVIGAVGYLVGSMIFKKKDLPL